MAQTENGGSSTSVHAIVRQRFIDQIEADEVAIQFITEHMWLNYMTIVRDLMLAWF